MNLPPFEDFLKTLSKDKLEEIIASDKKGEPVVNFSYGTISSEHATNNSLNLVALDVKICCALLELYHEWLSKELQNQ